MASYFETELATLTTKTNFTTHLANATAHQATQAHTDFMRQDHCDFYINQIKGLFDNTSLDTIDPTRNSLTLYMMSELTSQEKTDLQNAVEARGYSVTDNGDHWVIS